MKDKSLVIKCSKDQYESWENIPNTIRSKIQEILKEFRDQWDPNPKKELSITKLSDDFGEYYKLRIPIIAQSEYLPVREWSSKLPIFSVNIYQGYRSISITLREDDGELYWE